MKIKILHLGFILLCSFQGFAQFITEWNTGGSNTFTVPTTGPGYNYTATIALVSAPATIITTLNNVTGNAAFTGLMPNTDYQVKISGSFPRIYFNYGAERFKIKKITQWGSIAWTSFSKAFYGCGELNVTATDVPVLTGVTDMGFMFTFCAALNGPSNIGSWNTASVTDMSNLFSGTTVFNQNIGGWNTGAVTTMVNMFANAKAFNQNIGSWDTGSVTDMTYMFGGATAFNQNINPWNTGSLTTMNSMFSQATAFNQNIGTWNTSTVTDMYSVFYGATAFNGTIGSWNTSAVTIMDNMFSGCTAFNQNIGSWDTSAVTSMGSMFTGAAAFNKDISGWDTSGVTSMAHMFENTAAFNQDISSWDVASVWNMLSMFQQATAFNRDISNWDISGALYMEAMFKQATAFNQNLGPWGAHFSPDVVLYSFFGGLLDYCGMSVANYDATLIGFNELAPNGLTLGAAGMYYCNDGAEARAHLVLPVTSGGKGWVIIGDTSLAAATPLLASPGTTAALTSADCNNDWSKPTNRARKMVNINPNGNSIAPASVLINHNNIGALPSGVTSANGYYQISNATNSTRVSNRLTCIADAGTYTENGGVIIKVYYAVAEYTNIVVDTPPAGEIIDAGWFISNNDTAAGVVATMSAGTYALPGAEKIIPINSGSENGIAFVEFKLNKMGTIGMYAKTTDSALSPTLSSADVREISNVVLYPNPAKSILNLKLPDATMRIEAISIINMLGQTVYNSTTNSRSIDVAFLSRGLYELVLTTDTGNFNGRFVKE